MAVQMHLLPTSKSSSIHLFVRPTPLESLISSSRLVDDFPLRCQDNLIYVYSLVFWWGVERHKIRRCWGSLGCLWQGVRRLVCHGLKVVLIHFSQTQAQGRIDHPYMHITMSSASYSESAFTLTWSRCSHLLWVDQTRSYELYDHYICGIGQFSSHRTF